MLWFIIPVIIVIIDQFVKHYVVGHIQEGQMIPVVDNFFYLTLHRNPGGAWSILQNSKLVFLIVIPIISAVVIYYLLKNKNPFLRFALSMVLGGAIGNYIDRLFIGKVTDYLLFYIGSYAFPVFNVADMAVTCGTILLAVYILFFYRETPKSAKAGMQQEDPGKRDEGKDAE